MDIGEEKQGAFVILKPAGRIDGYTAPELEKKVSELVERGDTRILLDGAEMSYISSAGLRTVLISSRKCQQGGGKFSLCALQPDCSAVMKMSGFLTILDVYETRDEAIAAQTG